MKKSRMPLVTAAVVVATLLWCGWLLRDRLALPPWLRVQRTDLDINSGDFQCQERIFCLPVKSRISETPLSREVRRLGIAIPSERAWRPAFVQYYESGHGDYAYGFAAADICDRVVRTFNEMKTPDERRRAILTKFMANLRTEDAWKAQECARVIVAKIAAEHGLEVFTLEYLEELKRSETWKEDESPSNAGENK